MTELVGRTDALAEVREALGRGPRAVLVHGEAGVGKSALVEEALAGVPHRTGGALRTLAWMPFLPLRRAFGDLPDETWAGDSAWVLDQVESAAGDTLLVFEDMHWADAGTLQVVEDLLGRVPLVVTVRRGDPAAADVAVRLEEAGMARLDLDPLRDADARTLIDRLRPGLGEGEVRTLLDRTGGNPLLIEELSAADGNEESLRLAVLARCRDLPDDQLEDLALIALAGRPLPAVELTYAGEVAETGIVVVDPSGLARIRHALIGEVVADLLSDERRVRCHTALARILTHPGDVARHLLEAGDLVGAREAAHRAVEEAATAGERWRHLVTEAEATGGPDGILLRVRAVEAASLAAEPSAADRLLADLDPYGPHGVVVALARATHAFQSSQWDRYLVEIEVARSLAEPGTLDEVEVLTRESAAALIVDGEAERALGLAQRAVTLAEKLGGSTLASRGLLATALSTLELDGWEDVLEDVIAESVREGDLRREFSCRLNLVIGLSAAGELDAAWASADETRRRAQDLRLLTRARTADITQVMLAAYRGDHAYVRTTVARLLAGRLGPTDRADAVTALATVEALEGRVEEAYALAEGLVDVTSHTGEYQQIRLMALILTSQHDRAAEEWAAMGGFGECDDYTRAELVPLLMWWAWESERPLPELPEILQTGLFAGKAAEARGVPALARGAYAEAAEHFAAARAGHGPRTWDALWCGWAEGEARRLAGLEGAVDLARESLAAARERGYEPIVARCERTLRLLGVRPARRPGQPDVAEALAGDDKLSRREREVVALVVEGLTDREIAARLGVAHRTVQVHVASARRKLGADNRSHLAAVAVEGS